MIHDLDDTLKELLNQKLPEHGYQSRIDIKFDTPDKDWATTNQDNSVLNLFLYDIRENLQLRSNERYLTRNGMAGTEDFAPTRIDFTYLISFWASKGEQDPVKKEHEILGQVLETLLCYPILPQEVLQGKIQQQSQIPGAQLPRAWIAQPEDTPKTWEFWGSNEWRLKAGISYRVTLYIQPKPVAVDLVTETEIRLQQINSQ